MEHRPFKDLEAKWQKTWEDQGIYRAKDHVATEKFYGLIEFPYPSGEGIHMGHPRPYTAVDVMTRKRRMEGKNVLYPMGWDAFGLPTENYAIKFKVKPQEATRTNVANFRRQIKSMGIGFDWSREVNTTDPEYYRWTQWMFLQFLKSRFNEGTQKASRVEHPDAPVKGDDGRMAYKATSTINWCPSCKIGLANEEAVGGVCERCGTAVEKREKEQWMIRITAYAKRLLEDLDTVDYLERVKSQQVNWIGKSEGAYVDFRLSTGDSVRVFTTRPDTLFGATYLVLAPEHDSVTTWMRDGVVTNAAGVSAYREAAAKKTDMERGAEGKEKTGAELKGITATNPATNEQIPVWIADYVLAGYGTGAIMAVPAHDERDFAFAETFHLPIRQVVTDTGEMKDSDFLNGLTTGAATQKIAEWLADKNIGEAATTYKLRDWVFSRQRYWGEPIPVVHCAACGTVPVPEDQLPVLLPDVESYEPTDTGESPLSKIRDWVEVPCPACGGDAERETDTMPNWAGSSWYFLRYCDPHNTETFASPESLKYWMPVDLYNGGMEHTTLHLLYSRFWHKFLWDIGAVPKEIGPEPYKVRRSHGLVLAADGEKMSKSKGNGVNPDVVVQEYGADALRTYQMFMGPFDQPVPWDTNGIEGVKRFLDKVWRLFADAKDAAVTPELETLHHKTIKKVGDDIESMAFNTAVSQLMILTNAYVDPAVGGIPSAHRTAFLQILAPFAPHLAEELWSRLGNAKTIHRSGWPAYDPAKIIASTFELVVQVNGKVRDKMTVPADISEVDAIAKALASENVQRHLAGNAPKAVKYVKGRLVTVVV